MEKAAKIYYFKNGDAGIYSSARLFLHSSRRNADITYILFPRCNNKKIKKKIGIYGIDDNIEKYADRISLCCLLPALLL
jgi:hypothetical protein